MTIQNSSTRLPLRVHCPACGRRWTQSSLWVSTPDPCECGRWYCVPEETSGLLLCECGEPAELDPTELER